MATRTHTRKPMLATGEFEMTPFFSIIIPVYNVAPYLRECLDSVLAQTFSAWVAICVDDGSTDSSGVILDEYASKDVRLRVIHQSNAGVSVARNVAMKIAVGEWLTFLDGDDKFDSRRLQALRAVIECRGDIDWIHETKYATNKRDVGCVFESTYEIITDSLFLDGWKVLKRNALLCLNTYKRTNISAVQFPVGVRYAEDDIFELRCLPQCKSAAVIGYCGYWYRVDRTDAASRKIDIEDSIKIHQLLLETVESQKSYIDALGEYKRFVELFTQTVRKDFGRIFRKYRAASSDLRKKHRIVSRRIYSSPYFSTRYAGYCRTGYGIYMSCGWIFPMLTEDFIFRVLSKLKRSLIGVSRKEKAQI